MPEASPLGGMTPWLVERAQRDPDELALCADGIRITWEELARRVDTLARRLGALGLVRGDRVALLMEPSARFVELVHAAQRLELTLVPLSTRAAAPELAALLAHAEPALVLHDHAHAGGLAGGAGRTCEAAAALDAVAPAAPRPSAPVDLDAVATILYTSGTTGRAKGVMLTHGNHRASAAASRARLGARPDDRWLCPLPLFHVGGLSIVLRSVLDGTPLVLHPRFDARAVWEALATERITLLSLVPTMVHRLLAEADTAPTTRAAPALRCVLVGGAACDGALHARARAHGLPIVATYGLTEAASQVATAAPSDPHELVGTPVPGTTVRIAEPDAHGRGEIVVAGPTVMAGYFRDADATAAALRGGWLHTGDVGHLDDAGRLQVLDRRTDLVVTGGENVYPTEVETVLRAHPDVADAAVFGVRDAEWGRCVHAAVVPRAAGVFDEAALRRWCRDRLAGFKTPRTIVPVDALPRTASGKLRRSMLAR